MTINASTISPRGGTYPGCHTMKVYRTHNHGSARVYVTPGRDHPEVVGWTFERDHDGHVVTDYTTFTVQFVNGEAEVEERLGQYLVEKGLASTPGPLAKLATVVSGLFHQPT